MSYVIEPESRAFDDDDSNSSDSGFNSLELMRQINELYEEKLIECDKLCPEHVTETKLAIFHNWVKDLTDQNTTFATIVADLEGETARKVNFLTSKLDVYAKLASNIKTFKDHARAFDVTEQRLEELQHDRESLLEKCRVIGQQLSEQTAENERLRQEMATVLQFSERLPNLAQLNHQLTESELCMCSLRVELQRCHDLCRFLSRQNARKDNVIRQLKQFIKKKTIDDENFAAVKPANCDCIDLVAHKNYVIDNLLRAINTHRSTITNMEDHFDGFCQCLQTSETKLKTIEQLYNENVQELQRTIDENKRLNATIETINVKLNDYETRNAQCHVEIDNHKQTIDDQYKRIISLNEINKERERDIERIDEDKREITKKYDVVVADLNARERDLVAVRAEIMTMNREHEVNCYEKLREITNLKSLVHEMDGECERIKRTNEELVGKCQKITSEKNDLANQVKQLTHVTWKDKQDMDERVRENDRLRLMMEEMKKTNDDAMERLEMKTRTCDELKEEMERLKIQFDRQRQAEEEETKVIDEKQTCIERLRNDCECKDQTISDMTRINRAMKNELKQQSQDKKNRDNNIAYLTSVVLNKDAIIAQLSASLKVQEDTVRSQRDVIERNERSLMDLKRVLDEKDEVIGRLEREHCEVVDCQRDLREDSKVMLEQVKMWLEEQKAINQQVVAKYVGQAEVLARVEAEKRAYKEKLHSSQTANRKLLRDLKLCQQRLLNCNDRSATGTSSSGDIIEVKFQSIALT